MIPHSGVKLPARDKRFEETIVFVPHFRGNRASLKPFQSLAADLGFDSVAFDLSSTSAHLWQRLPPLRAINIGLRTKWVKEITDVLNAVKGPKVVFSFSFPSAAAVQAISTRKPFDIKSWICDGGPFYQLPICMWNYYAQFEPVRHLAPRLLKISLGLQAMEYLTLQKDVSRALSLLPQNFPVLSIRAWQDRLVPISAIDAVFQGQTHLNLETLTLPEADHIRGLHDYPQEYIPRLARFLGCQTSQRDHAAASPL